MYRLYIDETGNPDLEASRDPNHRYLSLTGLIIKHDHVRDILIPRLNELKMEVFNHDPDEPIVLHRKDIKDRNKPFHILRDDARAALFDARLISILVECDYVAITAVIDKLDHLERYKTWRNEPYHYCLEVLVERYVLWLNRRGAKGDVMGEVRGGRFDRKLEESFARLYRRGNENIEANVMQRCLTSGKLKLKRKERNIAGLQLADILAHPSALYLRSKVAKDVEPRGYGLRIAELLVEQKYNRSDSGKISGYGTKWLP